MPDNLSEEIKARRERMRFYAKGPGPAGYGPMPPLLGHVGHAPTHNIAPEYSFRLDLGCSFLPRKLGPGPAAYEIKEGQKANGIFNGLAYSLSSKHKQFSNYESPGPAAYSTNEPCLIKPRPPSWTIRVRTPDLYRSHTPAPNAYELPATIGDHHPTKPMVPPATLKGSRVGTVFGETSPGPIYNIGKIELIKSTSPAYSMRIKWPNLTGTRNPGPSDYNIKTRLVIPRTPGPAYSFGVQYSDFTAIPMCL